MQSRVCLVNRNPRLLRMVLAQKRWSGSCERSQIYCTICEKKKRNSLTQTRCHLCTYEHNYYFYDFLLSYKFLQKLRLFTIFVIFAIFSHKLVNFNFTKIVVFVNFVIFSNCVLIEPLKKFQLANTTLSLLFEKKRTQQELQVFTQKTYGGL